MPVELGQAPVLLPPPPKAEELPFHGPDATRRGEPPSPETARQLFRQFPYQVTSGPHETLQQLRKLCAQWLQPEVHTKEQILEMLMLEHIQVLGQEVFSEKAEPASCPAGDTESPAEEPQELGLQNTALGPREPLSCVVKEESDAEQGPGEGWFLVEQWRHLDSTQKEQYWDLMLETYGKMVSGGAGISNARPDLTDPAGYGAELAGPHLQASEKVPRPTCVGDRGENDKENLNLENYRAQDPLASGEPPPQTPLSGLFGEDEPRPFGEGEDLSEVQGNLQGEGAGELWS
ncbi:ZNF18 [Cervus elaphus hippelaphus]|uniref:ZNF18 n=1 Tax=Cervus elaphus hippelaphus TaxID=46360 RepID=A0A212DAF4_CEREH|nr:ZNF18 [Cervus elaphus hippelaphus]